METPRELFDKHASAESKGRLATLEGRVEQSERLGYGPKTTADFKKAADSFLQRWHEGYLNRTKKATGRGRKGHASTLRGIGKMGPDMLHKELERYEKIKTHLESKYAHVVAMGETKRYNKEEVDSAIKQLKDKIAAKGAGGRRGTRRTRRRR